MTPIESSRESASEPRMWLRFISWSVVVFLLYTLSLGPVVRFIGAGSPVLRAFYTPLMWVHGHVPLFRGALDNYMRLWEEHG